MTRTASPFVLCVVPTLLALLGAAVPAEAADTLRLATTTSFDNSGLFQALRPAIEKGCACEVEVIAVGTGHALRLGASGDVDAVLVHAPVAEAAFVASGNGVRRVPIMENDFLIVGPAADPARIAGGRDAPAALAAIARARATFLSRGDDSGTHKKETALWEAAGRVPGGSWYRKVGQGMGRTLVMAGELSAYTLVDRGTYLAMRRKVDLKPMVEGDPRLINPYAIIAVNPERHPQERRELAERLIRWFTSDEARKMIADYRVDGVPLFRPLPAPAGALPAAPPPSP